MTKLSDLQWVARARAGAEATPVITGVNVDQGGKRLAATDRHRLHIVTGKHEMKWADGIREYNAKEDSLGEQIEGAYPTIDMVIPSEPSRFQVIAPGKLRSLALAVVAYVRNEKVDIACEPVIFPQLGLEQPFCVNARYLADALDGSSLTIPWHLTLTNHKQPMVLALGDWRKAVIMPIRDSSVASYKFTVPEEWITRIDGEKLTTQSRGRTAKPTAPTGDRIDVQAMRVSLGIA